MLSPSAMNAALGTIIIAPLTTTLRGYPSRMEIRFENKFCEICLDQVQAVDDSRIYKESRGRIRQSDMEKVKKDCWKCLNCNPKAIMRIHLASHSLSQEFVRRRHILI